MRILQCHVKFRSVLYNNVKMEPAEIDFDSRKWMKLVQDYVHWQARVHSVEHSGYITRELAE